MNKKITQSLKQTIKNLEESLGGLERHNFNRASYKSWTDSNWNFMSTNGVKHDAVYLYAIPVLNAKANFGISFKFLSKGYNPLPLDIKEQKLRFSYCTNLEDAELHGIPKNVIYSKDFTLEEARKILKDMRKAFEANFVPYKSTLEDFINIFESAFNVEDGDVEQRFKAAEASLSSAIENANNLSTQSEDAYQDILKTRSEIKSKLRESDEYQKVQQLKKQLEKAEKDLEKKDTELHKKYEMEIKNSVYLKLHSKTAKAKKEFKSFLDVAMKKFSLPMRHQEILSKKVK